MLAHQRQEAVTKWVAIVFGPDRVDTDLRVFVDDRTKDDAIAWYHSRGE